MAEVTELKKVKGSIIMEPLIALNIIGIVLLLTVMIFSNLSKSNNGFMIVKIHEKIDSLQLNLTNIDETYDFEIFELDKTVEKYSGTNDLYHIKWEAFNVADELIFTKNQLIQYDEK